MSRSLKKRVGYGMMALVLMSAGFSFAQDKKPGGDAGESAAVKAILQKMNDQVNIPEVPEGQRASREQIDKLFEVMKIHEQIGKSVDMLSAAMRGGMQEAIQQRRKDHPNEAQLTPEQEKAFEAILTEYMKKMVDAIYSDDVFGIMKTAYQRYLSADDIEGAIAFYSSPAGQHFMDRQMKISLVVAPEMMTAMQNKVQGIIEEMTAKIKALDLPVNKPASVKSASGKK